MNGRPVARAVAGSAVARSTVRRRQKPGPTFASIIAKAGPQSAHFDLRATTTLFQDLAGVATPVTASGDPLGAIRDTLNGHLLAAATNETRAEYWIDPLTSEPVTWYDLVDDLLLWPTIEGAVGTLCVAYSTGAQVFDLTAGAHIPPGPMIAAYFFDFVLSNSEAAVMKATMDAIVEDDSWLGYVRDTTYVDIIAPGGAGIEVEFSDDPTHEADEWPDMDGLGNILTLSSARQRFRITVADSAEFNAGNAIPGVGEAYILDVDGTTLWLPGVADTLSPLVNGWFVSIAPLAGNISARYGALNVLQRSPSTPVAQVQYQHGVTPTGYDLHVQPRTTRWIATAALVRFSVQQSAGEVFPAGPSPDLTAATALTDLLLNGSGFTGALPLCPATLRSYAAYGFVDVQPVPTFGALVKSITLDNCNLTTMIDLTGLSGISNLSIDNSGMPGVLPSLTAATSGIPADVNVFRVLLTGNAITGYAGGTIAPDHTPGQFDVGGTQVRVNENVLNQTGVDNLLQACVDSGIVEGVDGGANRLYLQGGTNAHPSPAGMANKVILESRGWQVVINP